MTAEWTLSWRFDKRALPLADRHYNRHKIGSPQFVPPGRCICLISEDSNALWVTSWPFAQYVRHAWAGAWVNSLFRNECRAATASDMITAAVAASRAFWNPPGQGIVSFVNPRRVPGILVRGQRIYGFCYLKAGWKHVGFTKDESLWVWQQLPDEMPGVLPPIGMQQSLFGVAL